MDKKFFFAASAGFCTAGALGLVLRLIVSWSVLSSPVRALGVTFALCAIFTIVQFTLRYRKA